MSSSEPRQRVERVRGSRRAKLTSAPGAVDAPDLPERDDAASAPSDGGPNDERMRRDVPPHY
ncbi:hypothetical protein [Microbacterium sp. cx-59]|uniref:hypothetical protein n=1 Tax=Microbacterium sp. cx-59 TaxID=2891207 RepID=UPI001E2DA752|nr:hypothetical protein [Microbacterium sp. cx-59]MCC4908786.1 hypothetical protein [Microbacterium sp. cx-59]MCC4908795.1 hypothetical protein [Microbacterium sp. cx-59]